MTRPLFGALALASALLLAACGQRPAPAATGEGQATFLPPQTEALASTPAQPLPLTQPGGLHAQAVGAQPADKSIPIILVHGGGGFGRDEFGGKLLYWGGKFDV